MHTAWFETWIRGLVEWMAGTMEVPAVRFGAAIRRRGVPVRRAVMAEVVPPAVYVEVLRRRTAREGPVRLHRRFFAS